MRKQIPGQISMFDLMPEEEDPRSCGERYRAEGYTNAWDAMPDHACTVEVIDHKGNRFKAEVHESFGSMVFDLNRYGSHGYDICWWKEIAPAAVDPEQEKDFTQYIGKCKFCYWRGYGLYDPITHKRRKGTEGLACQWEKSKFSGCKNHSKWMPGDYYIPGMCSNCAWSNCFHYQRKPEYGEKDSLKAFKDPVEEPNIYCTREEGSVNRRQPFKDYCWHNFGACRWDRQHEFDVCDAWQSDGWKLEHGETMDDDTGGEG